MPRSAECDYLLIASGQVRYASYLANWRDFKDHIRKYVKDQPGWVNILPGPRKGDVEGWARTTDPGDAEAIYNACAQSRGILVHLFATGLKSTYFEMVKCNCTAQFPDVGHRGHSPGRSSVDVSRINQALNRQPTPTTQYVGAAQPAYQYSSYYQSPPYAATTAYAYPAAPMPYAAPAVPAYSHSAGGLPVNLGQGAVLTESRGIFIQNLSYSVGNQELWDLMYSVGLRPIDAKVHKDSRGQSKGYGTAKFANKEEAQDGVKALNGKTHKNKTLTVRLDADSTVVGVVPPVRAGSPLIVDGTNKSRVSISRAFGGACI